MLAVRTTLVRSAAVRVMTYVRALAAKNTADRVDMAGVQFDLGPGKSGPDVMLAFRCCLHRVLSLSECNGALEVPMIGVFSHN